MRWQSGRVNIANAERPASPRLAGSLREGLQPLDFPHNLLES